MNSPAFGATDKNFAGCANDRSGRRRPPGQEEEAETGKIIEPIRFYVRTVKEKMFLRDGNL